MVLTLSCNSFHVSLKVRLSFQSWWVISVSILVSFPTVFPLYVLLFKFMARILLVNKEIELKINGECFLFQFFVLYHVPCLVRYSLFFAINANNRLSVRSSFLRSSAYYGIFHRLSKHSVVPASHLNLREEFPFLRFQRIKNIHQCFFLVGSGTTWKKLRNRSWLH